MQGESPLQKPLILIFAGIAIVAVIGLTIFQWRRSKDEFSEVRTKVVTALAKKDSAALLLLANKEFLVGQADSENGATTQPEKIMPRIIQLSQNSKWGDQFTEIENIRILNPVSGGFQLMFQKTDNGWVWTGFLSINADDLANLTADPMPKVEYKEIRSEEAQGNEPSATD
jgi:hypothetical protein